MRDGYRLEGCIVQTMDFVAVENLPHRYITDVETKPRDRGKGYARRVLQTVCDDADAEGVVLSIVPDPQESTVDLKRLEAFYRSFGFTELVGYSGTDQYGSWHLFRLPRPLTSSVASDTVEPGRKEVHP